jgi:hypothetical protein
VFPRARGIERTDSSTGRPRAHARCRRSRAALPLSDRRRPGSLGRALRREIEEETHLGDVELGPWIWTRRHVWAWRGKVYDTRERFALVRVDAADVQPDPSDSLFFGGPGTGFEHQWWTVAELEATRDKVSPRRLAQLLREMLANGPPAVPIEVGV